MVVLFDLPGTTILKIIVNQSLNVTDCHKRHLFLKQIKTYIDLSLMISISIECSQDKIFNNTNYILRM